MSVFLLNGIGIPRPYASTSAACLNRCPCGFYGDSTGERTLEMAMRRLALSAKHLAEAVQPRHRMATLVAGFSENNLFRP